MITRRDLLRSAGPLWALMHAPALFGSESAPTAAHAAASAAEPQPALELLRLRLLADRFEEQIAFYRDTLRFPLIKRSAEAASFQAGSTVLEFVPAPPGVKPVYHFAFNIPENQIEAAREWTRQRVPLIVQRSTGRDVLHFSHWNAHALYFHDPSQHLVEFIARHTLANARPGAFDQRDILCASEIGVVTESVSETVGQLKSQLGIAGYRGYSDQFAPVGNEHGLFIVVNSNRSWRLTDQPAVAYPSAVQVRTQSRAARSLRLAGPLEIISGK